jgi:hypothetical protein
MSVEETRTIQPPIHRIHEAIQHITGTVRKRMVISQDKAIRFFA